MKPILNIDEMIEHMKEKGIKFNIISENEAKQYKFIQKVIDNLVV